MEREYRGQLEAYLQERFGEETKAFKDLQALLEYRCREDFSFAEPFFWAGFGAQGL